MVAFCGSWVSRDFPGDRAGRQFNLNFAADGIAYGDLAWYQLELLTKSSWYQPSYPVAWPSITALPSIFAPSHGRQIPLGSSAPPNHRVFGTVLLPPTTTSHRSRRPRRLKPPLRPTATHPATCARNLTPTASRCPSARHPAPIRPDACTCVRAVLTASRYPSRPAAPVLLVPRSTCAIFRPHLIDGVVFGAEIV